MEQAVQDPSASALDDRMALRRFDGPPARFWARLVEACAAATGASASTLLARTAPTEAWVTAAAWPQGGAGSAALEAEGKLLADACVLAEGRLWRPAATDAGTVTPCVLGVRLDLTGAAGDAVVLVVCAILTAPEAAQRLDRLEGLAAAVPVYNLQRLLAQARGDVERFANVLDLLVLLNSRTRFMAAAMTLCNELASRLRADRVSLGWLRKGYIRVRAISHMEKFEPKMAAVQGLEAVMEEAFEQDIEILWPAPADAPTIARDHERFAAEQAAGHVASVPLRQDGRVIAVLTAERKTAPFSEMEMRGLRLCADQAAPRLADLEAREAWFGVRVGRAVRAQAARAVGVEHTGAKLAALLGLAAAAFLFFGRWPHRVEAAFTLRSEQAVVLPAPFDGYLDEVVADKGAAVEAGGLLATLDTRDLLIEQASAAADLDRYLREAEKARAGQELADMRMAEAMAEQARARLDLVKYRLERALIRAPFAGAVVDGDLRERAGAPVRKGELLFRVARLDDLTVEAYVGESDVDHVRVGARVGVVFASRPGRPYPARVERIDPMAVAREGANGFVVRCRAVDAPEAWWRPGMTGIARIEAGKRVPIWLLTRRTADFVRLRWGW